MEYCCDVFKWMHGLDKAIAYMDFGKGLQPYVNVEVKRNIEYEIDPEDKRVTSWTTLLPMPLNYCPHCGARL